MRQSLLIFFCVFTTILFANKSDRGFGKYVDSVLIAINGVSDTQKISFLSDIGSKRLASSISDAYELSKRAYSLALKNGDKSYIYKASVALGRVYYQKDMGDSVIGIMKPLLPFIKSDNHKQARVYHQLSSAYIMNEDLVKGLKYSLLALNSYEEIRDTSGITNTLVNIANVYQKYDNFNLAKGYLLEAKNMALQHGNRATLANVYNTMGILYAEKGMLNDALSYFSKSTKIREELNDNTSISWNYNNLGGVYFLLQKYDESEYNFKKAFENFKSNRNFDGMSTALSNLAEVATKKKEYSKTIDYFCQSRNLFSNTKNYDHLQDLYHNLAIFHRDRNNYKPAFLYADSLVGLMDSLRGAGLAREIAEMQVKYDTEKKEQANKLLRNENELKKAEIKQKQLFSYFLISVLIAIIIIFSLLYQRRKIQQKARHDAALYEQAVMRNKAIIEAEEKERVRIAKDLHDGLGQLLSAAKLNLSSVESEGEKYKNTISLIDESVKEVRSISHNLMPNTLIRLGLRDAIRELATKINTSGKLKLELDIHGLQNRLNAETETIIYRVIQELLNNILKHAEAAKVILQLIEHDDELTIMVEDNGKGFNTAELKHFAGIGLKNIYSRIQFLKGNLNIDSSPGNGTTVTMEIPLK